MIKKDFFRDPKIGQLPIPARLLFISLWIQADDFGNGTYDPRLLKAEAFMYDDVSNEDVKQWFEALVAGKLILPYSVDGQSYYNVRNFLKHQKINRPSGCRCPAPPVGLVSPPDPLKKNMNENAKEKENWNEKEKVKANDNNNSNNKEAIETMGVSTHGGLSEDSLSADADAVAAADASQAVCTASANTVSAKRTTDSNDLLNRFKADVADAFQKAEIPLSATPEHWEKAFQLAQRCGPEVFLGGLDVWLSHVYENNELVVGHEKNDYLGGERPIIKTWLLLEFINSGTGQLAIRKAAPYRGFIRGEGLQFLADDDVPPESVTPACYEVLKWIADHELISGLDVVYMCDFKKSGLSFAQFLAEFPKRFNEQERKYGRTAKVTDDMEHDYQVFAERLRTEGECVSCMAGMASPADDLLEYSPSQPVAASAA
jgi:hypothetical protein